MRNCTVAMHATLSLIRHSAAVVGVLACMAVSASAQDARFSLTLTVNYGGADPVAWRGQPVLAEALLTLEDGGAAAVGLPDDAPWSQAVRLEVRDSRGELVDAEWTAVQPARGVLKFTPDSPEATAVFALSPEATAALAPGRYVFRAVFDTAQTGAAGTWQGTAGSRPVTAVIKDTSGQATTETAERIDKDRLHARWLLLTGRSEEALARLTALTDAFPNNVSALTDRVEILMELGRNEEAQDNVQRALRAFRVSNPRATHPPRNLLRLIDAVKAPQQ